MDGGCLMLGGDGMPLLDVRCLVLGGDELLWWVLGVGC